MSVQINGVTYTTYVYDVTSTTEAQAAAFDNATILPATTIPSTVVIDGTTYNVTKVAGLACEGRSALTSLTLPNSMRTLENTAFANCANLTTVNLNTSSGLQTIGGGVFANCSSLTSFFIPNSLQEFLSGNNFQNCVALQVTFGTSPSFRSIGPNDFESCTNLTSFTFPNTLTSIGGAAFKNCTSLTAIPGFGNLTGVSLLNSEIFLNCPLSPTVTIGNGVTFLAANVFSNCDFETLVIGSGLTGVAGNCINNCELLLTVTCNSPTLFGGSLTNCPILDKIDGSLTKIEANAINNCCGLELYLGDSITTVEGYSISSNNLELIRWPSNALSFPAGGVGNLPALTNYTNIDNVTTLSGAFLNTTAFTSFTVPPSVTNPLDGCFGAGQYLANIIWATDANIPPNCCAFNNAVENFVITGRPTSIGNFAFGFCNNIVNLTIPNSVTSMPPYIVDNYDFPFYSCPKLLDPTEVSPGVYQGTVISNSLPLVGGESVEGSDFVYNYFNPPGTNTLYVNYVYDPLCFAHGTKILCLNADLEDEYIPIEKLTSGSIVKTYKHGYRKIYLIGKGHMLNDVNRPHSCMYTMKKTESNGLIEDLTLTGGHSILVDDMCDETKSKVTELLGSLMTIDDKFLHVCSIHPDFEQVQDHEVKTYYHFVLRNDDDNDKRFAVYANGILAETPSFNQFIKHEFVPL